MKKEERNAIMWAGEMEAQREIQTDGVQWQRQKTGVGRGEMNTG